MNHYSLDELIARWKHEDLTPEQMIGQLLLLLRQIERRLRELERGQPAETERLAISHQPSVR